jgi:hypothetical protein
VIRFLLALYPKAWRRTYGEEYAALLEQTRLTPRVVLDVLAQGAKLHATVHRTRLLVGGAVPVSVGVEVIARTTGLTANILWPPTTPARTVALLALFAPWAALAVRAQRSRSHRPPVRS